MAQGATIGNEYWKLRSKSGRDKQYPTPELLLEACNNYFEWVQNNPLKEAQIVKYKDYAELMEVPKMRPFTINGLCNFIDLSIEGWRKYKQRNEFIEVTTRVEEVIYLQKFEGAASGFLNPNIIARDLGLQDKKEIEHSGQIDSKQLTDKEYQERLDKARKVIGL